jgi:chromate transporter
MKSVELGVLAVAAAGLALAGINEIFILFGAGFVGVLLNYLKAGARSNSLAPWLLLQAKGVAWSAISGWGIFWKFLKVGSILYGSGYVLFAFLDTELVKPGFLTRRQLIDAIAVGQFTPGPVFSSATFIGWQMAGLPGAIAATIGIFLPSFLFVAFLNPLIPGLRRSKAMAAFLDAVNMASVALILAVCYAMGRESITDWHTILIALMGLSLTLIFRKLNSAFVVLLGALLGYALSWLG